MRVLVTRRWPEPVERALQDRFEVVLNEGDQPLSEAELARAMSEFDVLCPTVSDRIGSRVIRGGDRATLIANYGVGFDHIDLAAAKAKGIAVETRIAMGLKALASVCALFWRASAGDCCSDWLPSSPLSVVDFELRHSSASRADPSPAWRASA